MMNFEKMVYALADNIQFIGKDEWGKDYYDSSPKLPGLLRQVEEWRQYERALEGVTYYAKFPRDNHYTCGAYPTISMAFRNCPREEGLIIYAVDELAEKTTDEGGVKRLKATKLFTCGGGEWQKVRADALTS